MKNTEILGLSNPQPEHTDEPETEDQRLERQLLALQAAIDEKRQYETEQHEALAKAGYDYNGRETLRAIMSQILPRGF